ncbi:MAG TPA: DUF5684 domain-containing protein [Spirochaetota bacterium]|nr:DUF5684 domain-containing protein [Spirochaetota bacterium]
MYDMPGQFPYVGRGALVFYIALYVVQALSLFKLAEKANVRNSWVSFIPVLQTIVFLHIIDKSGWCILLLLIPGVNIVLVIIWAVKFYLAFDLKAGLIVLSIIIPIAGMVVTLVMAFSERYSYVKSNRFAVPE